MVFYANRALGYSELADLLTIKISSLRQRVWRSHFPAPDDGTWGAEALVSLAEESRLPSDVLVPPHWKPRDFRRVGSSRLPSGGAVAMVFSSGTSDLALVIGPTDDEDIRAFLDRSGVDIAYFPTLHGRGLEYLAPTGMRLPPCTPEVDRSRRSLILALSSLTGLSVDALELLIFSSDPRALDWPTALVPPDAVDTPAALAILRPYLDDRSRAIADQALLSGEDDQLGDLSLLPALEPRRIVDDIDHQLVSACAASLWRPPEVADRNSIVRRAAGAARAGTDFSMTLTGRPLSHALGLPWVRLPRGDSHAVLAEDRTYVCPGTSLDVHPDSVRGFTLPLPDRDVACAVLDDGMALPLPRLGRDAATAGINCRETAEYAASILRVLEGSDVDVEEDADGTTRFHRRGVTFASFSPGEPLPFGRGHQMPEEFSVYAAVSELRRCGIEVGR